MSPNIQPDTHTHTNLFNGLGISETANILGYSNITITENGVKKRKCPVSARSLGEKALLNPRNQRSMTIILQADRKGAVTKTIC